MDSPLYPPPPSPPLPCIVPYLTLHANDLCVKFALVSGTLLLFSSPSSLLFSWFLLFCAVHIHTVATSIAVNCCRGCCCDICIAVKDCSFSEFVVFLWMFRRDCSVPFQKHRTSCHHSLASFLCSHQK